MNRRESRATEPSPNPIYDEVRTVRDLVEQVIGVLTYTAQDPEAIRRREKDLRAFFGRSTRLADVYLALDKDLNISELAQKVGMQRQNVSPLIAKLRDAGLAVQHHTGGRGDVWIRNSVIEGVVGLSKKLAAWRLEEQLTSERG